MMALDILIYGFLAYYLDCVLPTTFSSPLGKVNMGQKGHRGFVFLQDFGVQRKPHLGNEKKEEEYREKKKRAKRVVREARKDWVQKWTELWESDMEGSDKVLYSQIRNRIKKRQEVRMMDEEVRMMKTREEEKESWMRNFEKRLNLEDERNVSEAEELVD
uniref:Uncharacterized protein n=1 Tax=Timema shepardi TaxID=629360 RepID=A0A7R9G4J5_TIMSH|nr:unnamed protein product [Timema shepardi]